MALAVCCGATLKCSFGAAPSMLVVLPAHRVFTCSMPMATIQDNKPIMNILPFGMCNCPANPMVAAATAAALGVLTPMPCIPVTTAPWTPGCPKVLLGNIPALNNKSKLMCNWGGVIQILVPGQITTMVT